MLLTALVCYLLVGLFVFTEVLLSGELRSAKDRLFAFVFSLSLWPVFVHVAIRDYPRSSE